VAATSPADSGSSAAQPRARAEEVRALLRAGQYPEAFDRLLELYKDKVFHLALSILRNQSHAEDAAQEAFVRIWRGLPGYHEGASLSTWIYTIARNTCLTELRKRRAHPTVSLQGPEEDCVAEQIAAIASPDTNAAANLDVATILSALPEKYRRIVALFYLEQRAYEEVSVMLNIPLGTVKTLLFRAKKELLKIGARRAPPLPVKPGPVTLSNHQTARMVALPASGCHC
jgi:RNA polymerase sigma-70 factor, ECF subfamily